MINVPQYQARLPMSGGGGFQGNIDLTERLEDNPILQALMLIQQLKRQGQQDELSRRESEARIGQMQRPEAMQGQIVTEGGKTWLVDKRTGQKTDLGIKANPKVEELLKLIEMARQYEEPSEFETAIGESAQDQLKQRMGISKPVPRDLRLEGMTTPEMRTVGEIGGLQGGVQGWPTLPRDETNVFTELMKKEPTITVGKEPKTVQEFESEVKRLGKIDMKKARAYYDKWAGKWK